MKIKSIITRLIDVHKISKETLAGMMGVSVRTLGRWQEEITHPSYAERRLLKQILRGCDISKRKTLLYRRHK